MRISKRFFIIRAGGERLSSVISKKATFITKYTSTSYNEVLKLSFEQIDTLFDDLIELFEIENEARKAAKDD